LARKPRFPRRAIPVKKALDEFQVINYPLATESAMKKIEDDNTLVFICDVRANKKQIGNSLKKLYDLSFTKINTLIRPDGKKKAFVRLSEDVEAAEVASRIGIM
jgi:large subunit ribosomal protein L23Ae